MTDVEPGAEEEVEAEGTPGQDAPVLPEPLYAQPQTAEAAEEEAEEEAEAADEDE